MSVAGLIYVGFWVLGFGFWVRDGLLALSEPTQADDLEIIAFLPFLFPARQSLAVFTYSVTELEVFLIRSDRFSLVLRIRV